MVKKIIFGIVLVLIILLFGVFLGPLHHNTAFLREGVNKIAGPSCPNSPVLTQSLIDPSAIISITPLGNLGPPDHTIPTDHLYINLKNNNDINPANAKTVVSPGNITIRGINQDKVVKNGEIFTNDFRLDISACKEVNLSLDHINSLSQPLQQAFDKNKGKCDTHTNPNEEITYCQAEMAYSLKAGEVIGVAGAARATGIDLGAIDSRTKPKPYNNPKHYRNTPTICGLDLFDTTTKVQLYAKLGRDTSNGFVPRTVEPKCGEVNQDKVGTAQGNWITGEGMMDSPETWDKTLALVHDNFDPTLGIASIGGVIAQPQKIAFTPTHSGTINREWSEVTPDNQIYCFSNSHSSNLPYGSQQNYLLISLTDSTLLKAELGNGPCPTTPVFIHPTVYQR